MKNLSKGTVRGLVTIRANGYQHNVYLPSDVSPKNVAAVFQTILPRGSQATSWTVAGELMASFIAAVSPAVRPVLVPYDRFFEQIRQSDLEIAYDHSPSGYFQVIPVHGGRRGTATFSGNLREFIDWASKTTGLEELVHKVCRFKYNGGTSPGAERTVQVQKVFNGNIEGVDLDECNVMDPDSVAAAYRRYSTDRIVGDIAILEKN